MGHIDQHVSTIKRVEFTTIKCISVAFCHATLSIYSGNLLIEWPNDNLLLLKQLMSYAICIHTLYRNRSVTKTLPVSYRPCDLIFLEKLQLVSMDKFFDMQVGKSVFRDASRQ